MNKRNKGQHECDDVSQPHTGDSGKSHCLGDEDRIDFDAMEEMIHQRNVMVFGKDAVENPDGTRKNLDEIPDRAPHGTVMDAAAAEAIIENSPIIDHFPELKELRPFLAAADTNGRPAFYRVLARAIARSMPINWDSKGFSINVDIDGRHVPVCFGYPPESSPGQVIRTNLHGARGIERKTAVPEEKVKTLRQKAEDTGLFVPAGKELKCPIDRELCEDELESLLEWAASVKTAVEEHGLGH